jgi:uncharacterized membrane protein
VFHCTPPFPFFLLSAFVSAFRVKEISADSASNREIFGRQTVKESRKSARFMLDQVRPKKMLVYRQALNRRTSPLLYILLADLCKKMKL